MRKIFISILLLSPLIASQDPTPHIVDKMLHDFKKTLIKKGVKIFNAEKDAENEEVSTKKLTIDLKNPTFAHGILMTREGGVIKSEDIRIQAKTIQYIKREEDGKLIHKIEADGDLMIIYKNKIFVGDELEYDFIEKEGTIYSGKTYSPPWYIGGDKIDLFKDGSYKAENAFITTCENRLSSWDIHAGQVEVEKRELLKAKKVRFRFFRFPTFWFPSFRVNLKKFFKKPIIKYKVNFDRKNPRGSIRYQAYSWRDLALFLRLDYRLQTGFGGAFETEYFPTHGRSSLVTRSYLASDTIPKELKKRRRYRLQGAYKGFSEDKRTNFKITWDKFSDIKMPGDFKSDDFEINTAKKTEFLMRHQRTNLIGILHAHPRVNSFETIKQDIPTLYFNFRPLRSKIGAIFSNQLNISYLDLAYSEKLSTSLNDINSFRAETQNSVIWPFNFSKATLTPKMGVIGIFYNDSPQKNSKFLVTFLYSAFLKTEIYRYFEKYKHVVKPYIKYTGLTKPTVNTDHNYIFSIEDGFNKLNMIKLGIVNDIFSLEKFKIAPTFQIDLFANYFIGDDKQKLNLPKIYLNFQANLSSTYLSTENAFNIWRKNIDFSKIELGKTVNENLAYSIEFRYRSKYDFRKADHENFILNVSRKEKTLLESPLSDKRFSFLTHIFLRLSPYLSCHVQSHHGFGRSDEPGYNEFKIELLTMLSTSWKIKLSYEHTETDNRFSFNYFLLKI
jgi:hypothetical protein